MDILNTVPVGMISTPIVSWSKRRLACERWKAQNREYYLQQKRNLAARPDYKAHRREVYKQKVDELKLLGILPRKRGRPTMYDHQEALEMKRERAREYAMRSRAGQKISQLIENVNTIENSSERSD